MVCAWAFPSVVPSALQVVAEVTWPVSLKTKLSVELAPWMHQWVVPMPEWEIVEPLVTDTGTVTVAARLVGDGVSIATVMLEPVRVMALVVSFAALPRLV